MNDINSKAVTVAIFIVITIVTLLETCIGTRQGVCRDAVVSLSPEYPVTKCPHNAHALTPIPGTTNTWICRCPSQ